MNASMRDLSIGIDRNDVSIGKLCEKELDDPQNSSS